MMWSITAIMSKGLFSSSGMTSASGLCTAFTGLASTRGGRCVWFCGMSAKYLFANAIASSSVFTSTSPQPDSEQCMRAPPSSSSVTFSPMTISAMRGEPRYMLAFLSTITTMSQNAGMYAPPAALGPKSRQIWGTCPLSCTSL
jgi:hypothetical protein